MVINIIGINMLFYIRRDKERIVIKFSESNFKGIVVGRHWGYHRIWRSLVTTTLILLNKIK